MESFPKFPRPHTLTVNDLTRTRSFTARRQKNVVVYHFKNINYKQALKDTFPILEWIQEYQIKRDLPLDIIAAITVTCLQIPQGIAYAYLAEVPPVFGLYTAFFTAFVYFIFGTSRHTNFGVFAVICLMAGQIVMEYSELNEKGEEIRMEPLPYPSEKYRNVEILAGLTLTISIYMILMYIFRLGILTSILSQTLVESFTSACATHLVCSQIKDLLGLNIKSRKSDVFKVILTLYDVAVHIQETNYVVLSISLVTSFLLIANNEIIRPILSKRTKVPIPMELIVLVLGILVSFKMDLHGTYNTPLLGAIPTGLPTPMVPPLGVIQLVVMDALPITLVSYIITMALGFTFARKGSYEIRPNQELLALGLMNLVGAFFSCIPVSGSLSRSVVQYYIGGVSEFTIVISAFLILLVLLYLGPVLQFLPRCVLACIVICAVYKLFLQILGLKRFWLLSKLDAMIWFLTFTTTVIISIKIGLYVGITTAILVIFYHSFSPNSCLLGVLPNTEIYISKSYETVQEIPEIKIFRYDGCINFASKDIFKAHLIRKTGINAKQLKIKRMAEKRKLKPGQELPPLELPIKCIIVDFSAVTNIDPAGIESLRNIISDHEAVGVNMLVANASDEVIETIANFDFVEKLSPLIVFMTVHSAVLFAKEYILDN